MRRNEQRPKEGALGNTCFCRMRKGQQRCICASRPSPDFLPEARGDNVKDGGRGQA